MVVNEKSTTAQNKLMMPDTNVIVAIRAVLKPWHHFKESWATNATVVFIGTYKSSTYPCIFDGDGGSVMPARYYFDVGKRMTIKGKIGRMAVDFNTCGLNPKTTPPFFLEDRKYLVFMDPKPENINILTNQEAFFTLFNLIENEEIISIIDISQNKTEAESLSVKSHKKGSFKGFEFTPEKWKSLRNAKKSNVKEHNTYIPFIQNIVLTKNATLKHIRSYLGDPDDQYISETGCYQACYNLNSLVMEHERIGETYCMLELNFSDSLILMDYNIYYFKYFAEENMCGTKSITEEEIKKLGLTRAGNYKPRINNNAEPTTTADGGE